jgi:hypothetical protein
MTLPISYLGFALEPERQVSDRSPDRFKQMIQFLTGARFIPAYGKYGGVMVLDVASIHLKRRRASAFISPATTALLNWMMAALVSPLAMPVLA